MEIPCNTMAHRGRPIRVPVLRPIEEAILRDSMGREYPWPAWAYDEFDDAPDPDTYWDRMLSGDLK